jgi:hypothetical protein
MQAGPCRSLMRHVGVERAHLACTPHGRKLRLKRRY